MNRTREHKLRDGTPDEKLRDCIVQLHDRFSVISTRLAAARREMDEIFADCLCVHSWVEETAEETGAEDFKWLAFLLEGGTHFLETFKAIDYNLEFVGNLMVDLRYIGDGYLPFGSPPPAEDVPATCTERMFAWLREADYDLLEEGEEEGEVPQTTRLHVVARRLNAEELRRRFNLTDPTPPEPAA